MMNINPDNINLTVSSGLTPPSGKYTDVLYGGRHTRRLGWLMIMIAVIANVVFFFALGRLNHTPREPAERLTYSTMEIFPSALPDQEIQAVEDVFPEFSEVYLSRPDEEPLEMLQQESQRFDPRGAEWAPEISLVPLPLAIEAIGIVIPSKAQSQSAAVATGPAGLSAVDEPPRKISYKLPDYPSWAEAYRLEGDVTLRFLVDAEGNVGTIEVQQVTGDERFAEVARQCVAQWRFNPATYNSKPVAVWCVQQIHFKWPVKSR
jgi:protein TonB